MNGLGFTLLEQYVLDHGGEPALAQALAEAGFQDADPWVICGEYPLEDIYRWLHAVAAGQQLSVEDLVRTVCRWSIPRLLIRFRSLVAGFDSPMTLIANMSESVYPHLKRMLTMYKSNIRGFRQIDAQTLVIEIGPSDRPCSRVEGMLLGLGDHFGMPATLEHPLCCQRGDDHCEVQVRFAPASPAGART